MPVLSVEWLGGYGVARLATPHDLSPIDGLGEELRIRNLSDGEGEPYVTTQAIGVTTALESSPAGEP